MNRKTPLRSMISTSYNRTRRANDTQTKENYSSAINIQAGLQNYSLINIWLIYMHLIDGQFRPRTQSLGKRVSISHK